MTQGCPAKGHPLSRPAADCRHPLASLPGANTLKAALQFRICTPSSFSAGRSAVACETALLHEMNFPTCAFSPPPPSAQSSFSLLPFEIAAASAGPSGTSAHSLRPSTLGHKSVLLTRTRTCLREEKLKALITCQGD